MKSSEPRKPQGRPKGAKDRKTPPDCHPNRKHHANGLCASCDNRRRRIDNPTTYRRWYEANKPRILAQSRNKKYLDRYGVTYDFVMDLLDKQNGLCAICTKPVDKRRHLDHNHETGKIRAILCGKCNIGLGHFDDSPELLYKAADYLRKAA